MTQYYGQVPGNRESQGRGHHCHSRFCQRWLIKMFNLGWGDDSNGVVFVTEAWGPEFGSSAPRYKLGIPGHVHNPSAGGYAIAHWLASLTESMSSQFSKRLWLKNMVYSDWRRHMTLTCGFHMYMLTYAHTLWTKEFPMKFCILDWISWKADQMINAL